MNDLFDFDSLYSKAINEWPKEIELKFLRYYESEDNYSVEGLYTQYEEIESLYLNSSEEILTRTLHTAIYQTLCEIAKYCTVIEVVQLRKGEIKNRFENLLNSLYLANYPTEDKKMIKIYFQDTRIAQKKVIKKMLESAKNGSAEEQFVIGEKYYWGDELPRNYKDAIKWYKLAANRGHKKSQYKLGTMYERGEGVLCDYEIAHFWYGVSNNWNDEFANKHLTKEQINNLKKKIKKWVQNI